MRSFLITTMLCVLSGLILLHCAGGPPDQREITDLLPAEDTLNGWKTVGPSRIFRGKDLFVYMNGGAEEYLPHGFKQLLAQKYSNENNKTITLELFEMENPAGAEKVYVSKADERGKGMNIGDEAVLEEYYLNFREKQFLVTLTGSDPEKEIIEGLLTIAKEVDEQI
ncbi:MAG: DUF6599 family protein [Thermodesulfobacteriota bacterium]|nr:DUF6599 family protein [Thermodesulfobacteriota bacterium]